MNQTEHLQAVLLSIAKDIDSLCRKHKIRYYLLGGSALGAIRHKGFIPWDDDFDIVIAAEDYYRFLEVAEVELPQEKYYIQKGLKDWPEDFSKVKLRGTLINEVGGYKQPDGENGIYVDVFRLDNGADTFWGRLVQYSCGKLWMAHTMRTKGYKGEGLQKKLILAFSGVLNISLLNNFVYKQYIKFNDKETGNYSEIMGRARWKNAFTPKAIYGTPNYVPFEDTEFPVHEQLSEYLTRIFGDYMKLPPENQRKGIHTLAIDFGDY